MTTRHNFFVSIGIVITFLLCGAFPGFSVEPVLVRDINTFPRGGGAWELTKVGSTIFFVAEDSQHGTELWSFDGNTATLIKDIVPGKSSSDPWGLTAVGGELYFTAEDLKYGEELWKYRYGAFPWHMFIPAASGMGSR